MVEERVLDKIQKCLALSKSCNAHEAAAALRQAQKLMDKYGVDEADIDASSLGEEAVDVPIQVTKKGAPVHLRCLVGLIEHAFGVRAIYEDRVGVTDLSYRIRYFGPKHKLPLAIYAHKVVYKAMESSWLRESVSNPEWRGVRGARASFMVGWVTEVKSKVEAIGFNQEAGLERLLKKRYGSLTQMDVNRVGLHGQMVDSGINAAKNFSLHRPMDGESQKLLAG